MARHQRTLRAKVLTVHSISILCACVRPYLFMCQDNFNIAPKLMVSPRMLGCAKRYYCVLSCQCAASRARPPGSPSARKDSITKHEPCRTRAQLCLNCAWQTATAVAIHQCCGSTRYAFLPAFCPAHAGSTRPSDEMISWKVNFVLVIKTWFIMVARNTRRLLQIAIPHERIQRRRLGHTLYFRTISHECCS